MITTTTKTFDNCYKFRYVCTNHNNIVFEHRRMDDHWISEKRDRYGNRIKYEIRTNDQMRPIFNHMFCVAECDYYTLATNADFSVHSV